MQPRISITGLRIGAGRARRGATLVEFALTAPLLILLLVGIVEFGWLIRNTTIISNAAREGARAAAVGYTPDRIYERAADAGKPLFRLDAEGNIINGDIEMESSADGMSFGQFPAYSQFPPGSCPVDWKPGDGKIKTRQGAATARATAAPRAQLIPVTQPELAVVLVKKKPTPVPTAAPTPTPAPTLPPVESTPTPDPTPDATVPPPGATPTPIPGAGAGAVACQNSVPAGHIVRVTVVYEHNTLTGFFPFLRGREIRVVQVMRRDGIVTT